MRGMKVVIICKKRIVIAILSAPLIRKSNPIKHSSTPKKTKKVSGGMNGIVRERSAKTKGLAGLKLKTLRIPNQKNTTKIPSRDIGTEISLKKWRTFISNVR